MWLGSKLLGTHKQQNKKQSYIHYLDSQVSSSWLAVAGQLKSYFLDIFCLNQDKTWNCFKRLNRVIVKMSHRKQVKPDNLSSRLDPFNHNDGTINKGSDKAY